MIQQLGELFYAFVCLLPHIYCCNQHWILSLSQHHSSFMLKERERRTESSACNTCCGLWVRVVYFRLQFNFRSLQSDHWPGLLVPEWGCWLWVVTAHARLWRGHWHQPMGAQYYRSLTNQRLRRGQSWVRRRLDTGPVSGHWAATGSRGHQSVTENTQWTVTWLQTLLQTKQHHLPLYRTVLSRILASVS